MQACLTSPFTRARSIKNPQRRRPPIYHEELHATRNTVSKVPATMRVGSVLRITSYVTSNVSEHTVSSSQTSCKRTDANTVTTWIAFERKENLAVLEEAVRTAGRLEVRPVPLRRE